MSQTIDRGNTDEGTVRSEHSTHPQFHIASRLPSLNSTLFTGANQAPDILEFSKNREEEINKTGEA